jgi:hypothetical protein
MTKSGRFCYRFPGFAEKENRLSRKKKLPLWQGGKEERGGVTLKRTSQPSQKRPILHTALCDIENMKRMEPEKSIQVVVVVLERSEGSSWFSRLRRMGSEAVCKHQERGALSEGFHVFGVQGEHRIPLRGVKEIHDLSGPKEVVFLATKANDAMEAGRVLLPFLMENSVVVSLQNGICEEALAEILGRNRVIGCVVGWGASMHGPGELEITSGGEFVIGSLHSQSVGRLPLIKQMLDEVAPTRISENIMGELYAKLIINACINSLGVIAGRKLGELLAMKRATGSQPSWPKRWPWPLGGHQSGAGRGGS